MKYKVISVLASVVVVAIASIFAVSAMDLSGADSGADSFLIANVEALSNSEGGFDCVLIKDDCKVGWMVGIDLYALISKYGGNIDIKYGDYIDLSSLTEIYAAPAWYDHVISRFVRCRDDVRCRDVANEYFMWVNSRRF